MRVNNKYYFFHELKEIFTTAINKLINTAINYSNSFEK